MENTKTKIEELYENEKSRGFVNHLIHAYLPVYKTTKVWEFEDKKSCHKCSVCHHDLIDLGTITGRLQNSEEYKMDFIIDLCKELNGEEIKREDHPMIKHITHGAILAFTGEKTNTHLCQQCIQELLHMFQNGLLMGDKNIAYQINKMRRNTMFNTFADNPALDKEEVKTVKEIQKKVEKNPKHVATFGDIEALKELKKKMEQTKNNE